jgi:hypothetical protein
VERLAAGVGADHPDVALLELADRAREVGHGDDRHGVGRAGAALATVALTPTARSLGTIDRHGAEGVGAAHARAEVVGIGHAVEDQQQRRLGGRIEDVVERDVRQGVVDDATTPWCGRALRVRRGARASTRWIAMLEASARATRSRIRGSSRPDSDVQRVHGLRPLAQARRHRVESEKRSSGRHGLC